MSQFNRIILGDCIEEIIKLENGVIDCLIVDPPYSSGARRDADKAIRGSMTRDDSEWFSHDNMTTSGFIWFMRQFLVTIKPRMKPGALGYIFIDWRQYPTLAGVIESAGYRLNDLIVWDKAHFGMGNHYRNQHELISFFSNGAPRKPTRHDIPNIIQAKIVSSKDRIHPTEKPISLLRQIIEVSTNPGDLVVDPMCGSGSTLYAAKQTGRQYLGIEINPVYLERAESRLKSYTSLSEVLFNVVN